jgi:hypothetical protein
MLSRPPIRKAPWFIHCLMVPKGVLYGLTAPGEDVWPGLQSLVER